MAPRGGVSRRGDAPAAPGRGDEARPDDGGLRVLPEAATGVPLTFVSAA